MLVEKEGMVPLQGRTAGLFQDFGGTLGMGPCLEYEHRGRACIKSLLLLLHGTDSPEPLCSTERP